LGRVRLAGRPRLPLRANHLCPAFHAVPAPLRWYQFRLSTNCRFCRYREFHPEAQEGRIFLDSTYVWSSNFGHIKTTLNRSCIFGICIFLHIYAFSHLINQTPPLSGNLQNLFNLLYSDKGQAVTDNCGSEAHLRRGAHKPPGNERFVCYVVNENLRAILPKYPKQCYARSRL
jgi:hypothetical protein